MAVVLRVAAASMVVGLATVAGVTSFHGPTQRSAIAAASQAAASPVQVRPAAPVVVDSPKNIATPIAPRAAAYLDALKRDDIPVADIPTLLLVADSVCARQSDTNVSAQAERLMTAFPGRWRPQQAAIIVDRAIELVCGGTTVRGASVSADAYPAK
ncbi:MAG: DUF732 domain-containing protein [Pseudonocardiaceae bacterium]